MRNFAIRLVFRERWRSAMTVAGTGTLFLLMIFLGGIYEGVKNGSTGYVSNAPAEIWACQKNSNNLLRSSSFLSTATADELNIVPGVAKVESILRLIASAEIHKKNVTAFIIGISNKSELSRPPILRGTSVPKPGEIILDQSFVKKHHLDLGDSILVNGQSYAVCGISRETNATVAQLSFISMTDAEQILGFPGISSFFLISLNRSSNTQEVIAKMKQGFPDLSFYTKEEFITNNLDELNTGVLPILWTIALLGFMTGGAIISLMMYVTVQEHRKDYALLKALGMQQTGISAIVLSQALLISSAAYVAALCGYVVCDPILSMIAPEISVDVTAGMTLALFGIAIVLACIGSLASISKLSGVYPTEVFRA